MRRRTAAWTAGGMLIAGAVLAGCGLDRPQEVGDVSLSGAEQIVCARTIVEGSVLDVHEGAAKDRISVTLAVADWIKPTHGRSTVNLDIVDPAAEHGRGYTTGEHVLMIVLKPRESGATALRGEALKRYRDGLPLNLRRAKKATCPDWVGKV